MNIYSLIKLNRNISNFRLKFFGLWGLYVTNQRFLAVHFDPVMACNLRCKMCYFTDKEYVKKLKGIFPKEDLPRWAEVVLKRAIKLQIGCGTEPTLYKDLPKIIQLGKKFQVPYISLTTNANLLTEEKVQELVASGLDEFTISLHGVHKEEYENFMGKASYEKFHQAIGAISQAKSKNPNLKLRVNFTFNKDNFYSLQEFFPIYGKYNIDYLQLRPMKTMGNTEYSDTDISSIAQKYNVLMEKIKQQSIENGTHLIANLDYDNLQNETNTASYIREFTYCYIRPGYFWREDFDWKNESLNHYLSRNSFGKKLWRQIFTSEKKMKAREKKTSLNYDVL